MKEKIFEKIVEWEEMNWKNFYGLNFIGLLLGVICNLGYLALIIPLGFSVFVLIYEFCHRKIYYKETKNKKRNL